MASFERTVPRDVTELAEYLTKLHENQDHIKKINVNKAESRIEIDLSWSANKIGGYPDVYIPVKRTQFEEAKELLNGIISRSEQGFPPTDEDSRKLFDLIDQGSATAS